jgi:hypothetical protein
LTRPRTGRSAPGGDSPDSGNRALESFLAAVQAASEVAYCDPLTALDYVVVAIRNYHDSGGPMHMPLATLAAIFDRLGRYEAAATIAGFAFSPLSATGMPEFNAAIAHLRDVLGDQTHESGRPRGR